MYSVPDTVSDTTKSVASFVGIAIDPEVLRSMTWLDTVAWMQAEPNNISWFVS